MSENQQISAPNTPDTQIHAVSLPPAHRQHKKRPAEVAQIAAEREQEKRRQIFAADPNRHESVLKDVDSLLVSRNPSFSASSSTLVENSTAATSTTFMSAAAAQSSTLDSQDDDVPTERLQSAQPEYMKKILEHQERQEREIELSIQRQAQENRQFDFNEQQPALQQEQQQQQQFAPGRLENLYGASMVHPIDTHTQMTNQSAMAHLTQIRGWPPISHNITREGALFCLYRLENLLYIVEFSKEIYAPSAPGSAFAGNMGGMENVDTAVIDENEYIRGPAPEHDQYYFEYSRKDLREIDRLNALYRPARVIGRVFGMDEEIVRADAEAVSNIGKPGNVIDVAAVESLCQGMHTYVYALRRALLLHFTLLPVQHAKDPHRNQMLHRIFGTAEQIKANAKRKRAQKKSKRRQSRARSDKEEDGDDDDDDNDDDDRSSSDSNGAKVRQDLQDAENRLIAQHKNNSENPCNLYGNLFSTQPAQIELRLNDLHYKISNMLAWLRETNLILSTNTRPHGLPMQLMARGLVDRQPNTVNTLNQKKMRSRIEYLEYTLQRLTILNLRRRDGDLYKEIIYNGHRTQSYEIYMSIDSFVHNVAGVYTNRAMWHMAIEDSHTLSYVAGYLKTVTHTDDNILPDLATRRGQWSTRTGIYTSIDNRFWEYGKTYINEPTCPFNDPDAISTRYIDFDADPRWTTMPISDLPTPALNHIMQTQNWSLEVQFWFCVMMGRLFYEVNQLDNWQVAVMLKGVGGSGKSSLLEAVMKAFHLSDVGVLQNNIEEQFGMQTFADKKVLCGYDIRSDFRLPQTMFQSLVTGERVALARKNKSVLEIQKWTAQIIFATNTGVGYKDDGGAITRRIIPFYFNVGIQGEMVRTDLPEQLEKELVAMIIKYNRCYLEVIAKYGKQPLQKILPPEMRRNREQLREETGDIAAFIAQCGWCEEGNKSYVKRSEFIRALKAFVRAERNKQFEMGGDNDFTRQINSALQYSEEQKRANVTGDETKKTEVRYYKEVILPTGGKEGRIYGIILPLAYDPNQGASNIAAPPK